MIQNRPTPTTKHVAPAVAETIGVGKVVSEPMMKRTPAATDRAATISGGEVKNMIRGLASSKVEK